MGKTIKGKNKVARKIAAAKRKMACKTRGGKVVAVAAFCLALLAGCATSDSAQPAKSQTQNNTFDDCIVIVAAKVKLPLAGTNKVVSAEGGEMPALELFTQTQSLESSGTESFSQTATQTPTTDIKPDIDVHYNDAWKNATDASRGVLEQLTAASASKVVQMMSSGGTGTVEVQKADGSAATVKCENGQCSLCADCAAR